MEKQQHINPEYFKTGLSPEEYSHLAACPFCCEQFADYIENQELITAPAHLKSSIMERSRDLDVLIVAGSNHLSKRLQLFYFSLKVGAAVLCALTMLTILPGVSREISARQDAAARQSKFRSEQQWDYYETVNYLTEQLGRLSNINMEVFKNDKKER
ncbi:MAG: hypothetical protein ACLRXA_20720 [Clostridium sp.]